ncbi:hypothetical protein PUG46_14400 [Erwiniaceae bacterium L1_55_4]|nr:hypothetical protein [Erwiniaceae bacterium L1_55_4]
MPAPSEIIPALLSHAAGSLAGIGLLIVLNVFIQLAFALSVIHQGLQDNV